MLKNRKKLAITCSQCNYKKLCLPYNLSGEDTEYFDNTLSQLIVLDENEEIFYQGSTSHNLYAVYSGYCKEYWIDVNGNEQVKNFYFPGDILGFESIPKKKHSFSAKSLTPVKLCVIPMASFPELFKVNSLRDAFIKSMCYKMHHEAFISMTTNARARIATFLIQMALRYQERKIDYEAVYLPMTRVDVSQFLGIAHETLSRILHEFKNKNYIAISYEKIKIIDLEAIRSLSNSVGVFGRSD